jgi:hypothetical protein
LTISIVVAASAAVIIVFATAVATTIFVAAAAAAIIIIVTAAAAIAAAVFVAATAAATGVIVVSAAIATAVAVVAFVALSGASSRFQLLVSHLSTSSSSCASPPPCLLCPLILGSLSSGSLSSGFYPLIVGFYTLYCWILPFTVGLYPSSLLGPPRFFHTHSFANLPIPLPSSEFKLAHIPSERRGARVAAICSAHPRVLVIEPTSLMRGEGLVAGWLGAVAATVVAKVGGGGGGTRPISTVMQLMSVLNSNFS